MTLGEERRGNDIKTIKHWNTTTWKTLVTELQRKQYDNFPVQENTTKETRTNTQRKRDGKTLIYNKELWKKKYNIKHKKYKNNKQVLVAKFYKRGSYGTKYKKK